MTAPESPAAPAPAIDPELRVFARTFAEELANLASGVEGHAHTLIDVASRTELVPRAAEGLWGAVRRLRQFHGKLLAFVADRAPANGTTDLPRLLGGLREELRHMELGLTFAWRLPPRLPVLRVNHDELHDALLFLCAALLRLERGARRLTATAENSLDDGEPEVRLELLVEWDEDHGRQLPIGDPGAAFVFERDAARNLLENQGGALEIDHRPGHAARAVVRLPAVPSAPVGVAAAEAPPLPEPVVVLPRPTHRYGGVLLLEGDPAVRAMVAAELKTSGRAVFACADSAAARSLLQATPERFELLIVDHDERLDAQDPLAAAALRLCPSIRICVLAAQDRTRTVAADVHRIVKPFGPHELRAALLPVLQARGLSDPVGNGTPTRQQGVAREGTDR